VTKFVTPTDALVLSPSWPRDPDGLPEVFDAFARVVAGWEPNEIVAVLEGGVLLVVPKWAPEVAFRLIAVTRDGSTVPGLVPTAWAGRVTREVIVSYFAASWQLFERQPGWGVHLPFSRISPTSNGLRVEAELPAKWPLVDPVRDAARVDTESEWAILPVLGGDWAGFLTGWENVDGFTATLKPGAAWLARRTASAISPTGRLWWEIRGLHDANDGHRFEGEWARPVAITLYLGWPAYVLAAAGQTTPCEACHRAAIQGRRYCGTLGCNRARATERRRRSRSGAGG
jgi:hypothetical protein